MALLRLRHTRGLGRVLRLSSFGGRAQDEAWHRRTRQAAVVADIDGAALNACCCLGEDEGAAPVERTRKRGKQRRGHEPLRVARTRKNGRDGARQRAIGELLEECGEAVGWPDLRRPICSRAKADDRATRWQQRGGPRAVGWS